MKGVTDMIFTAAFVVICVHSTGHRHNNFHHAQNRPTPDSALHDDSSEILIDGALSDYVRKFLYMECLTTDGYDKPQLTNWCRPKLACFEISMVGLTDIKGK